MYQGNYISNKHKNPENYVDHLLFMFYPFRNECEIKIGESSKYYSKL